jgi:ribosomal protein S18 acetylase RimI-like enzyme
MENNSFEVATVNKDNFTQHPGAICFINPKHPAHLLKLEWMKKRFKEGLVIKLIYTKDKKKVAGFIEYIPGEFAWRAVSAKGYIFIHCLYVYPNKNKNRGLGTQLINEAVAEAEKNHCIGVAAVSSSKSFMANRDLFIKNGFKQISNDGAGNELLSLNLKEGLNPVINDWNKQRQNYQGLHIVYSKQCPWVARMVDEIKNTETIKKLNLIITELTTPAEAQNAPSLYSTFNLIYNGKLMADRYISITRFNNILKKEKLI